MTLLNLICCGEEKKWTLSHICHSVEFCSLCPVNGQWEVLGSGPDSLVLTLEEGLKAVLHLFKARHGDTQRCACNDPPTSKAERGILRSAALMVRVWCLQLWRMSRCGAAEALRVLPSAESAFPPERPPGGEAGGRSGVRRGRWALGTRHPHPG